MQYSVLSGNIGDEVNVNGNWGVIGQPGFGIPITVKLNGMSIYGLNAVSAHSNILYFTVNSRGYYKFQVEIGAPTTKIFISLIHNL